MIYNFEDFINNEINVVAEIGAILDKYNLEIISTPCPEGGAWLDILQIKGTNIAVCHVEDLALQINNRTPHELFMASAKNMKH